MGSKPSGNTNRSDASVKTVNSTVNYCDMFHFQFCNETAKFVDICLQHMPMDLIPEIDDVTILLSNLQRNPSV
jgi:hypothetical protein